MNDSTSTLGPISGAVYDGYPIATWRRAAQSAVAVLRTNPRDPGAQATLLNAQDVLREHASRISEANLAANIAGEEAARDPGKAASFGMGAADMASFGFGDEAAGALTALGRILPGGESPRQAYLRGRDANRAFAAQAEASNPWAYGAGQAGALAATMGAGVLAKGAPLVSGAVRAAGVPTATLGKRLLGALRGAVTGGAIGGTAAYGAGEEGPIADISQVPRGAAAGAVAGGLLAELGSAAQRANVLRIAQAQKTLNDAEASAFRPAAAEASARVATETAGPRIASAQHRAEASQYAPAQAQANVRFYTARGQQAETQTRIAQETEADRILSSRAGAQSAEARAVDIPLNRQMKEDRAVLLAFRKAKVEAGQGRELGRATPEGRVQMFREWAAKQGMSLEATEQAISRMQVNMPGAGFPRPQAAPSAPTAAPGWSHNPDEAARAAFNLAEAAGQDPVAAARRAGGIGRNAAVTPPSTVASPQRGATRAQLAQRQQAITEGVPATEGPPVNEARDAGVVLSQVVQTPFEPTRAASIGGVLQNAAPQHKAELLTQLELGRDAVPPLLYHFLKNILTGRPQ